MCTRSNSQSEVWAAISHHRGGFLLCTAMVKMAQNGAGAHGVVLLVVLGPAVPYRAGQFRAAVVQAGPHMAEACADSGRGDGRGGNGVSAGRKCGLMFKTDSARSKALTGLPLRGGR